MCSGKDRPTTKPIKQLGLRFAPKHPTPTMVDFAQELAFAKSQLQSPIARHSYRALQLAFHSALQPVLHRVFLDPGADCCFVASGSSIGFSQDVGKVHSEPPTLLLGEFPNSGFLGKFNRYAGTLTNLSVRHEEPLRVVTERQPIAVSRKS